MKIYGNIHKPCPAKNSPHDEKRSKKKARREAKEFSFFCNGCGQSPCMGKCESLCPHGIMIRDFCDDCLYGEDTK